MKEALGYMRRGELVPDSTVWEMVRERGECLHCGGGFILDGFPRTLGQAESLKQLMDSEGLALTAVVNYELPFERDRGAAGWPPDLREVQGGVSRDRAASEGCGSLRSLRRASCFRREDDRPESIKVRLEAYDRSTAPLIEFYRKLGLLVQGVGNGDAGGNLQPRPWRSCSEQSPAAEPVAHSTSKF